MTGANFLQLILVVLILVAVGTVVFHFWSPWWWTPIASNWGAIDTTIIITFWITGAVRSSRKEVARRAPPETGAKSRADSTFPSIMR